MRVVFVVIFWLLTAPMKVRLYLAISDLSPVCGYISLSFVGITGRLPAIVLRNDQAKRLCLVLGKRTIPIRIKRGQKKHQSLTEFAPLKKHLQGWGKAVFASAFLQLGLENASATAIFCAFLRQALGWQKWFYVRVAPQYHKAGFVLQVRCIAVFRLGKLLATAILLGAALLWRKMAGGAAHGADQGQANQRSHANSP